MSDQPVPIEERIFATLAAARTANNGVLSKEQWLHIVRTMVSAEITATMARKKPRVKKAPGSPRAPRPRNPLFDALALATGTKDLSQITRNMGRSIAVALVDIMEVCPVVTPEEITRRAQAYKTKHRDWPLTAPALAKHWSEFGGDRTREAKADIYQEPPDWKLAAIEQYGAEVGGEMFAKGWFELSPVYRSEILARLGRSASSA